MLEATHEVVDLSLNDTKVEPVVPVETTPVVEEAKPAAPVEDATLEAIQTTPAPQKPVETVPLPKYMETKNQLKEAQLVIKALQEKGTENFTNTNLDEIAAKYDVDPEFVKSIAAAAKADAIDEMKATIDPILSERQAEANNNAFNEAFERVIVAQYGDQIDKETFKEIALNPAFAYLKSFDGVVKKFFPHATQVAAKNKEEAETKEETIEGGSNAAPKVESIDFAKMTPAQHESVIKDPAQRAKYYQWKDSKV